MFGLIGFVGDNWQAIVGTVGLFGGVWHARQIRNVIKVWAILAKTIIEARKDGEYSQRESEEIIDATARALFALVPFYQKYTKKKEINQ